MKISVALGSAARMSTSSASIVVGELRDRQAVVELDLGRDHDVVGTEVLGAQMDARAARSGCSSIARRIFATTSGAAASPTSRLAISIDEHDRDHDEQHADREAAGRVPARLVGDARRATTPTSAKHEPDERADVFEQHDRELGDLRAADELPRSTLPAADFVRLSCSAVRNENASSTIATEQHADRPRRRSSSSCGWQQLLDALEDREHAAHAEQHERDDERPEVAQRAVAERMHARRPGAATACRRASAAPGCRCRRASGSPRRASTPRR